MNEADIFDDIRLYLPKYLSPQQQRQLFTELAHREQIEFYLPPDRFPNDLLQGDCWTGFIAINFYTREQKPVSGVVLSNSCDVDIRNARDLPVSILFSPLVKLSKIVARYEQAGRTPEQTASRLEAIRRQQVTSMFHFPERSGVIEESVILLDNVHSHPLSDFAQRKSTCVFKLRQTAFYLFIIKLAIHLTRIQEGVARF